METLQTFWFWALVGFLCMAVGSGLYYVLPEFIIAKHKRFSNFLVYLIIGGAIILILTFGAYTGSTKTD